MVTAATTTRRTVVALAGRRIDAAGSSDRRFPIDRIDQVRAELQLLFEQENVVFLVCSAACGADLIALDVAQKSGIDYRIVLPFSVERFRQSSVVDRPGDWGLLFDQIMREVPSRALIVLPEVAADDEAYAGANSEIVRLAAKIAAPDTALAIVVWEGQSRQGSDATASFLKLAEEAGMKRKVVRTC
jgi:hypothetical protein